MIFGRTHEIGDWRGWKRFSLYPIKSQGPACRVASRSSSAFRSQLRHSSTSTKYPSFTLPQSPLRLADHEPTLIWQYYANPGDPTRTEKAQQVTYPGHHRGPLFGVAHGLVFMPCREPIAMALPLNPIHVPSIPGHRTCNVPAVAHGPYPDHP